MPSSLSKLISHRADFDNLNILLYSVFACLGALPAGYTVVSPGITPQGPLILNVGTSTSHQPLAIGSQVQFVQVSTVPTVVQPLPGGLIQVTPSGQVTTTSSLPNVEVGEVHDPHQVQGGQSIAAQKSTATTTTYSVMETSTDDINALKNKGAEAGLR